MRLSLLPAAHVSLPPKGLFKVFLLLQDAKPPITVESVLEHTPSMTSAKTFLALAQREGLLMRMRWGRYLAASPQVALASVLLPPYYRELWRTHDILERALIPHAFACITASSDAGYVPNRPITAVPEDHFPALGRADVFGISLVGNAFRASSSTTGFEWPDGSSSFKVRALRWDWTALVLGAIGLPRELSAARALIRGKDVDAILARRLNAFGLSPTRNVLDSEPSVHVPPHIDRLRGEYAESLRMSEAMEGPADG